MTDTERDLLRSVCEVPDDDEPRLVYADWLDENGQGERAEFIRLSLTDPRPTVYESGRQAAITCKSGKSSVTAIEIAPAIPGVAYTVRRGFPDHVTLTTAQFIGGPCGSSVSEAHGLSGDCPHCHGTGTIPGLARELFERWPITWVRLSDREPQPNSYGGPVVAWHSDPNEAWMPSWIPYHLLRVMASIVDEDGDLDGRTWLTFPTPEAAHAALSDAAVAYGRELVGLRALPKREPARVVVDMTGRLFNLNTEYGWIEVPDQYGGLRRQPTGDVTATITGEMMPFNGTVGKEVYVKFWGDVETGPWIVDRVYFESPLLINGEVGLRNVHSTRPVHSVVNTAE